MIEIVSPSEVSDIISVMSNLTSEASLITGIMSLKDSDYLLFSTRTNVNSDGGKLTSLLLTSLLLTSLQGTNCDKD